MKKSELVVPYDLQCEKIILSCFCMDNSLLSGCELSVDHFYEERHQQIFSKMSELIEEGIPVTAATIAERLSPEHGVYLSECLDASIGPSQYEYYLNKNKSLYIRRMSQRCLLRLSYQMHEIPLETVFSELKQLIESNSNGNYGTYGTITGALKDFLSVTDGDFSATEVIHFVKSRDKRDIRDINVLRVSVRKAIQIAKENGDIQKVGTKDGIYRKVENKAEEMDYLNAPTNEFPVIFPLGIHKLVKIYPGNIIIIAGSKSAGKTAFLLNVVKENMGLHGRNPEDIVYMNSEMGETELRIRLELFNEVNIKSWRFKPISRVSAWADIVTAEKKIFIIDFLEITDNFWLIAKEINEIHKKLKDGIAIIAIQKDANRDTARGGSFSLEKARLYLALDHGIIKIVDAKAWRNPENNPRGQVRKYKLVKGSIYLPQSEWEEENVKVR